MGFQTTFRTLPVILYLGVTLACGNSTTAPGPTAGSVAYRLEVRGGDLSFDPDAPACVPMLVPPEGQSASTIIRLRRSGSAVIGESSDPQLGNIQIRLVESAPQFGLVRPFAGEIVGWALDVGNPFDPAKDVRVTFSKAVVEGEGFSDPSRLAINGRIVGAITFENGRGAVGNCQTVSFSLNRYFPGF